MIYAEITFTGNVNKNNEKEFYIKFYGDNGVEQDKWNDFLLIKYNSTKDTDFHDIYFSGKYIISREIALNYLSSNGFKPSSDNLFYKTFLSRFI